MNGFSAKSAQTAHIPMSVRELQVLLALCTAAPLVQNAENARKLVKQLVPYLVESFAQEFTASPFLREIEPSPWENITSSLTTALLSMGLNFPELQNEIEDAVAVYTGKVLEFVENTVRAENVSPAKVAATATSLHGFLEAASRLARFWSPDDRLRLTRRLRQILSEQFFVAVESAFAAIRGAEGSVQWKRYVRRHEANGSPLGALMLQRGLMKMLVASTSLIVTKIEGDADEDVLDVLLDGRVVTSISPEDFASVETYSELAAATLTDLENGASYTNTETEKSQQLLMDVKANALVAYCNCVVLSSTADPNILYRWLQAAVGDPVQMAYVPLAKSALKILAILAKDPNNPANGFISILQKFIVEGTPSIEVVDIAAKCLSHILNKASQDETITSLNTLGHVLSSANPEKALKSEALLPFENQPMASSLSLVSNTDDFRYNVYCNVIHTIVGIASHTKEPTMVSLAVSVLLQRVHKVPLAVNSRILKALGSLAPFANESDFVAINELVDKMGRDALWHDDQALIGAVKETRCAMAKSITRDSRLYEKYLADMLASVAAIGDEKESDQEKKQVDTVVICFSLISLECTLTSF